MSNAPVLALAHFIKTFVLEIDACNIGISVVLIQGQRPIALMSQTLSKKASGHV